MAAPDRSRARAAAGAAVAAMIYLPFQPRVIRDRANTWPKPRPGLCERSDPAGAALPAAHVSDGAGGENGALTGADAPCSMRARGGPARRGRRESCCWKTRTARSGSAAMITERPGPGRQGGAGIARPRSLNQAQAAIAALHARAGRAEDTDWAQIDLLYMALERMQAFARCHAQPRGGGRQGAWRRRRRWNWSTRSADRLRSYFHFHGVARLAAEAAGAKGGGQGRLRPRPFRWPARRRRPTRSVCNSTSWSAMRRTGRTPKRA